MKEFTCKKCKSDFKSENNKCPVCGRKSQQKLSPVFKAMQVGIFLIIVLVIITTKNSSDESPEEKAAKIKKQEQEAQQMVASVEVGFVCEKSIKKQLKTPDSAVFNEYPKLVQQKNTDIWWQTGTITATNSFNAKITNNYICKVKLIGSDAELIGSEIEKR